MRTHGLIRVVLPVLLVTSGLLQAAPVIKDFSSKGGQPSNKANAKDTMYLAKPGDKITFTVKAEGAEKYVWQVNKKADTKATGVSFTWTVPNEKDIWEIHLTATSGKEETHQEWVVSTLSAKEAPDLFDCFTDRKFRVRNQTDPWGRPLPKWSGRDDEIKEIKTENCCLEMKKAARSIFSTPSKTAYGTWRFKYWYELPRRRHTDAEGNTYSIIGYYFTSIPKISTWNGPKHNFRFGLDDGHVWTGCGMTTAYASMDLNAAPFGLDRAGVWHEVTLIRRKSEGYLYAFIDGVFIAESLRPDWNLGMKQSKFCVWDVEGSYNDQRIRIDQIETYDRRYLWPKGSIEYAEYNDFWRRTSGDNKTWGPAKRQGIVIRGRSVRLADIAKAVGKPVLFRYDPKTKTGVCSTDLVIEGGSELVMDGETLKMACSKDGEYQIRMRNGSTVRIKGSTITSTGTAYYLWRFPSEIGPETGDRGISGGDSKSYRDNFSGIFIAENSTIDNAGGLYVVGPTEFVLRNTKLTRIRTVTYPGLRSGGHWHGLYCKWNGQAHGLTLYARMPHRRFEVSGCTLSGDGDILIIGGDSFGSNILRDCNLEKIGLRVKKAMRNDWNPGYVPSTLRLVNVRTAGKEMVETDAAAIVTGYYLDLVVKDASGKNVPDATVTITNESDDDNYPAECLDEHKVRTSARKEGWKHHDIGFFKVFYTRTKRTTTTGAGGHTPLPSDPKNVMVLTDLVQKKQGKKEFKYTITVERDGKKKVITGVNPGPRWYRPDPSKPTYTITAVLDGKTVTEVELKKGQK